MDFNKTEKLKTLCEKISDCQNCLLGNTRNQFVFGEGNPESSILFIGEGPGKEEDKQGKPFIGRSGKLLTIAIEKVFQKPRENAAYITNIVKCRPTVDYKMEKDRPPEPEEVTQCRPILVQQMEIIKPALIITLGASSTKTLLEKRIAITKVRGEILPFMETSLMPVFHPSYVLRNGGQSGKLWTVFLGDIEKAFRFAHDQAN
ncbi:MAG: uracil-DNA glycosylase [Leptospirales bacterium]